MDIKRRYIVGKIKKPDLPDIASKWWDLVVPELEAKGNIEIIDIGMLEACAIAYNNMKVALDKLIADKYITEYPNGSQQLSQFHAMYKQDTDLYIKLCNHFGLSPLARYKLGLKEEEQEDVTMIELLKGEL